MLPLPLKPFEEYFYWDDRPEYPAVFFFRIEMATEPDRESAQQALDRIVAHQPLLGARVVTDQNQRLVWEPCDQANLIHWHQQDGDAIYDNMPPIDIRNGPSFRLHGVYHENGFGLIFQVHHAILDGMGFIQILNDWFAAYHAFVSGDGKNPQLSSCRLELIESRCEPGLSWRERLKLLPGQWISIIPVLQFFSRKPIPLVPMQKVAALQIPTRPAIVTHRLSEQSTRQLSQAAKQQKASVNELLVRDLFLTLSRWKKKHASEATGTHFRMMIPVNERTARHQQMPACNHCTMIHLDRAEQDLHDPNALLSGIHTAFHEIRKWGLSHNFWRALALCRRLPGGLQKKMQAETCEATCVLTHVGNLQKRILIPPSGGDESAERLAIESIEIIPPIRPGTYAAFAVFYFQDRLSVCLSYDDQVLGQDLGESLATMFCEQIEKSADPAYGK